METSRGKTSSNVALTELKVPCKLHLTECQRYQIIRGRWFSMKIFHLCIQSETVMQSPIIAVRQNRTKAHSDRRVRPLHCSHTKGPDRTGAPFVVGSNYSNTQYPQCADPCGRVTQFHTYQHKNNTTATLNGTLDTFVCILLCCVQ